MLKTKEDVLHVIAEDAWMMEILRTAQFLGLPDWWICAGFVRSKIWDMQQGFPQRTPLADIDVIYFDEANTNENKEKEHEQQLHRLRTGIPWSVKNQTRMHRKNNLPPYRSALDGVAHFPETATALAVKLDENGQLILAAPWGIEDALNMHVAPTPPFAASPELLKIYRQRVIKKVWHSTWNHITYTGIEREIT